jgi:hypothetical protein
VPITSGSAANKVDNKTSKNGNDRNNFPGSGADTTCFYASPSFCNLLPFFFLKVVCNRTSSHYVYTYQASRSKYLDISFHFNLPIWSGRQFFFNPVISVFGSFIVNFICCRTGSYGHISYTKLVSLLVSFIYIIQIFLYCFAR